MIQYDHVIMLSPYNHFPILMSKLHYKNLLKESTVSDIKTFLLYLLKTILSVVSFFTFSQYHDEKKVLNCKSSQNDQLLSFYGGLFQPPPPIIPYYEVKNTLHILSNNSDFGFHEEILVNMELILLSNIKQGFQFFFFFSPGFYYFFMSMIPVPFTEQFILIFTSL